MKAWEEHMGGTCCWRYFCFVIDCFFWVVFGFSVHVKELNMVAQHARAGEELH